MISFKNNKNQYCLRNTRLLVPKQKLSAICGIEFEHQTWKDLPKDIKSSDSLNPFKSNIKRYGTLVM